jgi:fluoride exporter
LGCKEFSDENSSDPGRVDNSCAPEHANPMIWTCTQVALGGALGAVARFATVFGVARLLGDGFPFGTIMVNIAGSFAMGLLFVVLAERQAMHHAPFMLTGILGGFTTFSAFSLDAARLWERGDGMVAVAYVMGSVLLSIGALLFGMMAAKMVAT